MEAVEPVYAHTASFSRRLFAVLVDALLTAVVGLAVGFLARPLLIFNLIMICGSAAYFTFCEGRVAGQTFGKRLLGIRVVDDVSGEPIGFPRALLRYLVSWISFVVLLIGYLTMVSDSAGQTWHDRAAHSVVIPS